MHIYRKLSLLLSTTLLIPCMGHALADAQSTNNDTSNTSVQVKDSDFPGRKTYSHVKYMTIEQLYSEYDNTVIVDARSPYEYKTLRILSAVNIPLSLTNSDFTKELQALRDKDPDKKIVFYCNGHTCMKSYKAAHRAKVIAKIDNVYAFDAGIFDWTTAYPEKAVLLEQTPVNRDLLISKEKYKQHMLPALQFINQADENTIVLDVRSRQQRAGFHIFSGYEITVNMNKKTKLKRYIAQAKKEKKDLYIYDAVGKQVRWLQYFLEQQNAGNYYFMEGGAMAFYDIPNDKLMD